MKLGVRRENIMMCDTHGRDLRGPHEGHESRTRSGSRGDTHAAHARPKRSTGADVLRRPLRGGMVTREMMRGMAASPIVFAHGEPRPGDRATRGACARGPTPSWPPGAAITRTRSTTSSASRSSSAARSTCAPRAINDEMKLAATHALAALARGRRARVGAPTPTAASASGSAASTSSRSRSTRACCSGWRRRWRRRPWRRAWRSSRSTWTSTASSSKRASARRAKSCA